MKTTYTLCLAGLLGVSSLAVCASDLEQLDDAQLSEVSGQEGVNLNLKGFSLVSKDHFGYTPLTLTYTMPFEGDGPPGGGSANPGDPLGLDPTKPVSYIKYSGFDIRRTDPATEAELFADPYQIQIEKVLIPEGPTGVTLPDSWDPRSYEDPDTKSRPFQEVIRLLNPKNSLGSLKWNITYDWMVATGVVSGTPANVHDLGAHIVEDLVIRGGGISLAPSWSTFQKAGDVRGAAFGLDLNIQIGKLILRPRGRDDVDKFDSQGVMTSRGTEMMLQDIKIGAANSSKTGVDTTKTWTVADVILQPGVINAYTGADGKPVLHMGIEWYRANDPAYDTPVGAMSIDQIVIKGGTPAAPTSTNFGGVSIGGMQIRYLDVVFRAPY